MLNKISKCWASLDGENKARNREGWSNIVKEPRHAPAVALCGTQIKNISFRISQSISLFYEDFLAYYLFSIVDSISLIGLNN